MGETDRAPEGSTNRRAAADVHPLLLVAVVFTILTVVGAGMLIFALMGRGGVLLGVVGAVQSVVCSAMLGAVVRRWRAATQQQRSRRAGGEHDGGQADAS